MMRLLPLLLLLAACGTARAPVTPPLAMSGFAPDAHVPDYVKRNFEPFSRSNAVAIALREWRAFGMPVNDDPPDLAPLPKELRPDQQPGLWQRVGDYWWLSMDAGARESGWTSRYNDSGTPYVADAPAWSAAFISYVMRMAGAGPSFPYSPLHADYINAAARGEGVLRAQRLSTYAPQLGDLICYGRGARARALTFDDLPAPRFFGHCDIVTGITPGQLQVIGGNVAGGVTLKHIPVTPTGMLATPDGLVLDPRYPWFTAIQVRYDA
jgi:hypothetical protein